MGKLTDRIKQLEQKIKNLESKVLNLAKKEDTARLKPESKVPLIDLGKLSSPPTPSSGTGLGQVPGYVPGILWNDADASATPFGQQPSEPTKGYHKHSHSKFAGGALDINTLELVEYEDLDVSGHNRHSQSYWKNLPKIKKDGDIEKIGLLDITFDKTSKKWLAGGIIDVEKTNLVQKDEEGNILIDSKGNEKKAPIYGSEVNTQNVVWDENAICWRFYAVFADEEGEE